MTRAPIMIDLGPEAEAADPAAAPPVPEAPPEGLATPEGRAMRQAAALAAARPSRAGRLFLAAAGGLAGLGLSVAVWDFVTRLLAQLPVLGWIAAALAALALAAAAVLGLREVAAIRRLERLGALRAETLAARAGDDLRAARAAVARLGALYAGREAMRWPLARLDERQADILDAATLLDLAETELMGPLDAAARAAVESAARQVAATTALVPLALADVAAALVGNLRMIRTVATIYGGRPGGLGGWRLARRVVAHLVATGALAVGDDLISSVAGGGLLAKLSRRFGEGVVNGALTARVGVAAIEVSRPMPFAALPRPRVSALVGRALSGLFAGRTATATATAPAIDRDRPTP